jgi:hypothetical protein
MTAIVPIEAGISLLSGQMFDYDNPGALPVSIEDIATNLSNCCRFAGAVKHFYSVAQHAVNCSFIVPPEHAFTALMHDTAEAFTNDITTPLKFKAGEFFKPLEIRIESAMAVQFGFIYPLPNPVKLADMQMLVLENEALRPHCPLSGITMQFDEVAHLVPYVDISSWTPERAKFEFLDRYEELRP